MHTKLLLLTFLTLGLAACGGSGGGTQGPTGNFTTVTGTITSPDSQTPIPDATVFVAAEGQPRQLLAKTLGVDCPEPSVTYIVAVCSEDDGTFAIQLEEGQVYTLQVTRGAFNQSIDVDLRNNEGDVEVGNIPFEVGGTSGTQIAVITGDFDRMQDILAKSGLGMVDDLGELMLGTEEFDLYDGDNSLDTSYPEISDLFVDNGGQAKIFDYDIVFINCAADEADIIGLSGNVNREILRSFVEQGGRIYATDFAYDFIEQVFPEYLDFYGDDLTPANEAEMNNVAQAGSTSEVDAPVNELLIGFLSNVSCDNELESGSCLNADGQSIFVEDFLPDWAIIDGVHEGTTGVTVWVTGAVQSLDEADNEISAVVRPLTVSANVGDGKIIYSSYHTAHSGSTGFLPQERILQYLVFE